MSQIPEPYRETTWEIIARSQSAALDRAQQNGANWELQWKIADNYSAECDRKINQLQQQVTQQADTMSQLQSTLETIADLAPGYGDVCELIARRARAALASIPKETE